MSTDARKFLTAQIQSCRGLLLLSGLLMLIQSGAALVVPWLAGELTAALIASAEDAAFSLNLIFLGLIGLFAMQALTGFGYGYLLAATQEHLGTRLRIQVHDHIQALPLHFHNEKSTGDFMTLLSHDIEVVNGFITGVVVPAIPTLLTFSFAFAMMWYTDWMLAGLAALSVPMFFLLSRRLNRKVRASSENLTRAQVAMLTAAEEHFRLIPLIKAFTREASISKDFQTHAREAMALSKEQFFLLHRVRPLLEFLSVTGLVCLLWIGSRMAIDGSLTTTGLVSFFLYGMLFARSMSSLASLIGQIRQTRVAVVRLLEVLNAEVESRCQGAKNFERISGPIEFQNVCFSYPGRSALFRDLSFEIGAGETVAITGPNGAGKSTLIKLLLRLYSPSHGAIRVNGTDISRIRLETLRRQIAWVPQNVFLLRGTVYDNIAFGRADATRQEVAAAARVALADDFVQELPDGYDSVVGRNGLKLSGGQQQRIALARALLKDAPILLLDEATVMFDPQSEAHFLVANSQYLANRTVIIITHHPQSLSLADRVFKLEDGKLTDTSVKSSVTTLASVR